MAAAEGDTARLVAEAEIRRTIAEYCQTCDDGRFEEFGCCFTTDAVMVVMGQEVRGRDAIVGWIEKAQPAERRGKHITVNMVVTVDLDKQEATGATDYMFLGKTADGPQITTAGRYLDVFVSDGDRWLFARREITFFDAPRG